MEVTTTFDLSVTAEVKITREMVSYAMEPRSEEIEAEAEEFDFGGERKLSYRELVQIFGDVNAAHIVEQVEDEAVWKARNNT